MIPLIPGMLQKVDFWTFYLLKVPSDLLNTQKVALIWNSKIFKPQHEQRRETAFTNFYSAVYDLGAMMLTYTTHAEAR